MRKLTGILFGRLQVVAYEGRKNYQHMWRCRCTCGKEVVVRECGLVGGNNKSCGTFCYANKNRAEHDPLIKRALGCWRSMKDRGRNRPQYRQLGMDAAWKKSFDAFLLHIGKPPTVKHTVDRINNRVGYFPGNVRWATALEQSHNRDDNWWVGDEHVMDAARRTGVNHATLRWRMRRNWPEQLLFTKPNKALKHENRALN